MLRAAVLFFALTSIPSNARAAQLQAAHPAASSDLYLKVQLKNQLKHLKVGDDVEGTLSQPVYSGAREVLPAGCAVRLTVDHFEKRRRATNDHWPWVVQVFTPRHENYPIFRSAKALPQDGRELLLEVSFLSIANENEVLPRMHNSSAAAAAPLAAVPMQRATAASTPVVTLEATIAGGENPAAGPADDVSTEHDTVTLEPGTPAKIILLDTLSASKSKAGDAIQARLIEPVKLGEAVVLPEGTLFVGRVLKVTPPRMLSRPGSLLVTFDDLKMSSGASGPIVASVSEAELDQRSHTRMDSEGRLSGGGVGKAWLVINFGVTAGLSKVSDDALQLVIEAIVSTATDASTAGTTRIFAACVSGIYMATRHGRDVVLPKFTQMRITLNRPLTVPASPVTSTAGVPSR